MQDHAIVQSDKQQSYKREKNSTHLKKKYSTQPMQHKKKNSLLKYALYFHLCSADIQPLEGTVGSPQQESMCPPPHPFCLSIIFSLSLTLSALPCLLLKERDWRTQRLHSWFESAVYILGFKYICLLQISRTNHSGVRNMALLTQMELRFAWCSCPDTKRSVCSWPKRSPIYT